ncbi:MAG: hypothetical protein AB7T63_09975 [Planctomycetota bacterium]
MRRPRAFGRIRAAGRLAAGVFAAAVLAACGGDGPAPAAPGAASVSPGEPQPLPSAQPRPPVRLREIAARAERYTAALGHFLAVGPTDGTWTVENPNRLVTWRFAPHPDETEAHVLAELGEHDVPQRIEVVHRSAIPRLFFEAPSWLFFANFAPEGPPVMAPLEAAETAVQIIWRPVHDGGGLTSRHVWFDRETAQLLRIEDRSRAGHVVRTVRRRIGAPALLQLPKDDVPGCCGRPLATHAADDIRRALAAPFEVFEPAMLPPGYIRIRADYRASDLEEEGEPVEVHRATLLYSDGLGLISLVIAPRPDLDAIVSHYGQMPAREGDPNGCPGLPASTSEVRDTRSVIRMRQDVCRTLLRRDDVAEDLSVMLLGRNELPLEAYVRAISGLRRVTGP